MLLILRQTLVEGLDEYKALGDAGLPIGLAIVYRDPGQPARLAVIKVERACRRQGVGRALVARIVRDNAATGVIGRISPLESSLSRTALEKFFRRCGAKIASDGRCHWAAKTVGRRRLRAA